MNKIAVETYAGKFTTTTDLVDTMIDQHLPASVVALRSKAVAAINKRRYCETAKITEGCLDDIHDVTTLMIIPAASYGQDLQDLGIDERKRRRQLVGLDTQ